MAQSTRCARKQEIPSLAQRLLERMERHEKQVAEMEKRLEPLYDIPFFAPWHKNLPDSLRSRLILKGHSVLECHPPSKSTDFVSAINVYPYGLLLKKAVFGKIVRCRITYKQLLNLINEYEAYAANTVENIKSGSAADSHPFFDEPSKYQEQ